MYNIVVSLFVFTEHSDITFDNQFFLLNFQLTVMNIRWIIVKITFYN